MTGAPLEGRLDIHLDAGGVRLASSRPLGACRVLEGRPAEEALGLLPVLFGVCGLAQAAAGAAALEDARGLPADPQVRWARGLIVSAESLREHLVRMVTGWAPWAEHAVAPGTLAAVLALPQTLLQGLFPTGNAFVPGARPSAGAGGAGPALERTRRLLTGQILGVEPATWSSLDTEAALLAWTARNALAARFVRRLIGHGWAGAGAAALPALPECPRAELDAALSGEAAEDFVAAPTWRGEAHETGVYARMRGHRLVRLAARLHGEGLLARTLARVADMVALLEGLERALTEGPASPPGRQAAGAPGGTGIGQVEAARGRLIHRLVLRGDRIAGYRILAPTEWNCHPGGILARALGSVRGCADAARLGRLIVEAIDPCVGFRLEIGGPARPYERSPSHAA